MTTSRVFFSQHIYENTCIVVSIKDKNLESCQNKTNIQWRCDWHFSFSVSLRDRQTE